MIDNPPQEFPPELSLFIVGLVLFFWLMAAIVSGLNARQRATGHGFQNERIRALEAQLRVAQGQTGTSRSEVVRLEEELRETKIRLVRRDKVITEQQSKIKKIQSDLKYSIFKTRELRRELAEKATEIVYTEAKVRAVEFELAVAHASTGMIDKGVLDYRLTQEGDEAERLYE